MSALALSRFGFAVDGATVLEGIDLSLARGDVLALLGPAGSGKSLLLRLISGNAPATVEAWGQAMMSGKVRAVTQRLRPRVATPSDDATRSHVETVLEALASDADIVCLDEPTAGLDGFSRARVLQAMRRGRHGKTLLYVTHNRRDVFALGGQVALFAAGTLVEHATVVDFFGNPTTELARGYVRTGSCPVARNMPMVDGVAPASAPRSRPRELSWVIPGVLAGCSRPGLLGDVRDDLAHLRDEGVRWLVCLEETDPIGPEWRGEFGLRGFPLPIDDMCAPSIGEMVGLCRLIDEAARAHEPVAVHCRGGLGRTGLALAAYVIWSQRIDHTQAIAQIRRHEPGFVQSIAQLEFLEQFAAPLQPHVTQPSTAT